VLPTHCCGHTNKVANGVTELCSLWSKNIHATAKQDMCHRTIWHIISSNPSLINDFLNKYSGSEVCNTSCGDPYVLQVILIILSSLHEGDSTLQDLDTYKEVFAK